MTGSNQASKDRRWPRDEKFLARWEIERTKGRARYILTVGLKWAFWMSVIMPLLFLFMGQFDLMRVAIMCLFYFVFGPLVGVAGWYGGERRYRKLRSGY